MNTIQVGIGAFLVLDGIIFCLPPFHRAINNFLLQQIAKDPSLKPGFEIPVPTKAFVGSGVGVLVGGTFLIIKGLGGI